MLPGPGHPGVDSGSNRAAVVAYLYVPQLGKIRNIRVREPYYTYSNRHISRCLADWRG